MTGLTPYLFFPGVARDALEFYRGVFGGSIELHTYGEFGRTDGPADDIAHGMLQGPVELFASDAGADEDAVHIVGACFSLLGTADSATMTSWFDALATGGRVTEPLQKRQWGDWDGQVTDRYGIRWLIGFQPS